MKTIIHESVLRLKPNFNLFKTVLAGGSLLLLLPAARADFTWPVYEPFSEYSVQPQRLGMRTNLDQSGTNWNIGNGASAPATDGGIASFVISNAAALSYPALLADTNVSPAGVQAAPSNGSADRGALITPQTGTWYASFLLNYQSNGGATIDRSIFQLGSGALINDSFTRVWTAVWLTPDYRLRLTKNFNAANLMSTADFSAPTPVVSTNVPHLIVMRYLKVPGGQDIVNLWVDPTPFGDDANMPPPMITTSNAANVASFNCVAFSNRKLNGASSVPLNVFQADEVRLGDSWSSVTPLATPAPGPIFAVTGGGTACPGDALHVGLSGSVSTNDYLLYTNGVYATTLPGNGSALDFGVQTTLAVYSVLASNTVSANIGWMSNSVYVAVTQPPQIVTEPPPVVTTTNNWAEFKAVVTGDALGFQWYRGSTALSDDAHITGSMATTLHIDPVTDADVGNYQLIVTNTCGTSASTTPKSLSLHAPDDLVWAGDAFNVNVWDVYAANAEWSGGTGFFNPGDNVTFDDSFTFANNITMNGYLTPTRMTVNASRDYHWVGTGSIGGPATLVKEGSGTLILDNNTANNYQNTFTGGTVISNGTINITNGWYNLGTGPVTLAGGRLASWNKGSGSPGLAGGLPNDLHVTANSTWQIDRTGDQCAGLLGNLIGNAGTTLSIFNSAANQNSINRIRFGGGFTNSLAFAVSINELATNSAMDLASYNSTGAQVFNGAISGQNSGFVVASSGATYLNAANTYARETLVLSGFLGGSGSINGRLVATNGATLGAGSQTAIGTFTVNNDVFLFGNASIRVDKSLSQSNDLISVTGTITNSGTGTVTLTNIGATALVVGDRFKIFSGPVLNGAALVVSGGGLGWANNLETDGSVQVIPGITYITNSPAITSFSLEGANAVISGTNGQAGGTCYLLMTTNIADPQNQWKTVATNVLGGDAYTFTGTNVVNAGSAQQYFMLSSTNYNP